MKVRDVMTSPVVCCGPSDSLDTAARLMWDHDCGIVPVVNVQRRLIGVVTDRDACMAAYTQGKRLCHLPVSTAMAYRVHTCEPNDSLESAQRKMREHQVRRLPVVDDRGFLLGMVSLADLASRSAPDGDTLETLRAVSTPRSPRWRELISAVARRTEPVVVTMAASRP
jgi:CBS domain-containing protein